MSARVRWSLPRSCGKECQPRQSSKFRYTRFCRFWLDRSCRKERTPAENPGKAPSCAVRAFGGSGRIEVVAPQNQAPSRVFGVCKVGNGGRSAQIPCQLFQKSHPSAHSQRAPVDPSKEPCLQPVVSPLPPKKKVAWESCKKSPTSISIMGRVTNQSNEGADLPNHSRVRTGWPTRLKAPTLYLPLSLKASPGTCELILPCFGHETRHSA